MTFIFMVIFCLGSIFAYHWINIWLKQRQEKHEREMRMKRKVQNQKVVAGGHSFEMVVTQEYSEDLDDNKEDSDPPDT